MRLYEVVKVFDLSCAPAELRESHDLAILRPRPEQDSSMIVSLRVGHYETLSDGPIDDFSTREITYSEYQLHRWLVEQGAKEGEDVFLLWKQDRPTQPAYIEHWQKPPVPPATVTVLRGPSRSCNKGAG